MAASSNAAAAAAAAAETPRWDEELCVPVNKIAKVMKKALPSNGKLSKQGKELVAQCISEFISYITGEASARCQREKRMTMNGEDMIWAMSTLGFDNYVEPLKLYLFKYRQYVNCNEMPPGAQSQFFAGINAAVRGTPAGGALVVVDTEGHGGVEEENATPPPEWNSGSLEEETVTLEDNSATKESAKDGTQLEDTSSTEE